MKSLYFGLTFILANELLFDLKEYAEAFLGRDFMDLWVWIVPSVAGGFVPSLGGTERQLVGFNSMKDLATSTNAVFLLAYNLGETPLARSLFKPLVGQAWEALAVLCKALVMMDGLNPVKVFTTLKSLRSVSKNHN